MTPSVGPAGDNRTVTVHLHRSMDAIPASVPALRSEVAAWLERDSLLVEVSDDGGGMMPRLDSPGLGVGLPFIADTADTLDIGSSPAGGAQLRMTFALAHSARLA